MYNIVIIINGDVTITSQSKVTLIGIIMKVTFTGQLLFVHIKQFSVFVHYLPEYV